MHNREDEKITVSCPRCAKSYHIRKKKIPPGATGVRCKSCGRPVRLTSGAGLSPVKKKKTRKSSTADGAGAGFRPPAPRCRLDLMTEEKRRRPLRLFRPK